MEPDQLPPLPPEIQRLEANKRAFAMPVLQLPSYDQIGKQKDKVFDDQGGKMVPKKPTFQDRMEESSRKMGETPDQLNPVGQYSAAQAEGYNNPLLPYDPTVDMNEVYAKYDPTTWADSARKGWDIAIANNFSGTKNLWYGLKDGITEGRPWAIFDNQYSRELGDITQNLDKMNPMRFSKEEQGTTSAWLKQVLPSLGYIAAGATEIAVQHGVLTLAGTVVGAIAGDGIGAVPGAVAGTIAAYVKDIETVGTVLTNMSRVARAAAVGTEVTEATVAAVSNANRIKNGAQMFARGLLATNGEAALMGRLAENRAIEEQKASYFKETGQYLEGDRLKEAEKNAKDTGHVTSALNWPLLAANEVYIFGNLLRGKGIPQVADKLAFRIDKATGKAVTKGPLFKVFGQGVMGGSARKVAGGILGDLTVQGNEEVWQSVIDDASVNYFTQKKANRDNYLEAFAEATYKRAVSGEATSDFLSGAVIGAVPGSFNLLGYGKVKSNTQRFVDAYNDTTEIYFNRLGENLKTNDILREAMATGDSQTAKQEHRNHLVGMVNSLARTGGIEAFGETLDALSGMDNSEFRKYTGLALNQEEQAKVLSDVQAEYKAAAKIRNQVDGAYQINPFEAESWFQKTLNRLNPSFDLTSPGNSKEQNDEARGKAAEVWEVYKATLTANLIKHNDVAKTRQELEEEGSQASPEFISLTGMDAPSVVANKKAELQSRISAQLPGWGRDKALLDKIESRTDPKEQYQEILDDADKRTPGIKETVLYHNQELQQENLLFNEVGRLNSKAGQRKEIKKILDWQRWYDTKTADSQENIAPAAPVAAPVVAQASQEQAAQQEPAAVPNVVPEVQPVDEGPSITTPPVIPDTTPFTIDPPAFGPEWVQTGEDVSSIYGEGQGEDYVLEAPITPPVKETLPEKKVQVDAIDPSQPEGLQVDETAIPEAVSNLDEGESIVPEENGVDVTFKGEPVKEITKEKGKVKIEKENGEEVELKPEEVPLLRTEKAAESPATDVATFIAANNLSGEKAETLRSLVANRYAEIVCR